MKKIFILPILTLTILFTSCGENLPISSVISNSSSSISSSIKVESSSSSSSIIEEEIYSSIPSNQNKTNPLEYLFLNVKNYNFIELPFEVNEVEIDWVTSSNKIAINDNKLTVKQDGIITLSAVANGYKKDFEIVITEKKIVQTTQNGIPIHYKFLTKNYKIGPSMNPSKIVIHNTANNASAKNEVNYLHSSSNTSSTSYHFAVDESSIYQAIPLSNSAYHAGVLSINKQSIGIEIARSTSQNKEIKNKAISNALTLIHLLKQEYLITNKNIITHKDASGKHCPHDIYDRYGINNLYGEIKEMVEI
ncbi:MAG: N-acetylmuramoyl-L-alanine amidase [Bacilli bacterium]|nr:N-acetylmuramoyl-L-alanine amidase [Bacilli bacterium]